MPKYYCDYCDTYLTHDSPSVRKTHCSGRKHKDNVKFFYQKWMEEQAQSLIDATTAAFKAGKIPSNPFVPGGAAVPPPPSLQGPRGQLPPGAPLPPMGGPLPPNMMIPGMRPPMGPMMSMGPMPMRPPMGPMMPMGPMPVRPPMMMGPQPPS